MGSGNSRLKLQSHLLALIRDGENGSLQGEEGRHSWLHDAPTGPRPGSPLNEDEDGCDLRAGQVSRGGGHRGSTRIERILHDEPVKRI